MAQSPVVQSIPAGPLDDVLTRFGARSGVQVLYNSAITRGKRSPGAAGGVDPQAALVQILAGTGLTYSFTGSNRVTITQIGATPVAGASGETTLETITVTGNAEDPRGHVDGIVAKLSASATKTDTPLIETPQSVSVVTADQIEKQAVQSVGDAVRYTPGVRGDVFGVSTDRDYVRVRGFMPNFYLDGMILPYGLGGQGLQSEPYGLERVEVLRGPSSVMYGQNPPGGIVAMSSKLPYEGAQNEVFLQAGSYDHLETGFDLNGGTDDGTVLYRAVGMLKDANTQVDFVDNNRYFLAPSLSWKPDDATSLTVFGQVQIDRAGIGTQYYPALGTLYDNPLGRVPTSLNIGEPDRDRLKREYYAFGYLFEHEFDNGVTFRQNARYATADTENYSTYLAGIAADNRTLTRRAGDINRVLQEYTLDNQIQFETETGALRHQIVAGLDARRSTIDNYNGFALLPGTIDLFNPVYGGAAPTINHTADNYQTLNQFGFYAQDQVKFDRWILTLGGRYDLSDSKLDNRYTGAKTQADDKAFTWRAGLGYLFDNGIAPYVAYSTSFEPVLSTSSPARGSTPFDPTEGEQFEAGIKYQPEGFNGFFSAAVFDLTQTNVSTVDPDNTSFQIQTGEVRSRGLELEGRAEIASGLSMIASYTYTDTEVTASNMPGQLGQPLPLIPLHQASLWLDYSFADTGLDGLTIGGGVRYIGDSYGDTLGQWKTPAYTLVDASLTLDLEKFWQEAKGTTFQVNVSNLFDKEHLVGCNSAVSCEFGQRRAIFATLRHRW